MRALRAALARIERAEQWFDFFGLAYDPRVLAVYRLRLLKRFGMEMAEADARAPDAGAAERVRLYAAALRRAHDAFARRLADEGDPRPPAACPSCAGCGGAEAAEP